MNENKSVKVKAQKLHLKKMNKRRKDMKELEHVKHLQLQREIEAHALKREQINQHWRSILLQKSLGNVKAEIQATWLVFERMLDKKDFLINELVALIETADDQCHHNFCSTISIMKTFCNEFHKSTHDLLGKSEQETIKMIHEAQKQFDNIISGNHKQLNDLNIMLYYANNTWIEDMWTRRGKYFAKLKVNEQIFHEEQKCITDHLTMIFKNMWDEYKAIFEQHVKDVSQIKAETTNLQTKSRRENDIIFVQQNKLKSLASTIEHLKYDLTLDKNKKVINLMLAEVDLYRNRLKQFSRVMDQENKTDYKRLDHLVQHSNKAVDQLTNIEKKMEKMLNITKLCRTYETQKEKILPFDVNYDKYDLDVRKRSDSITYGVTKEASCIISHSVKSISNADLEPTFPTLVGFENLFRRISQVEIVKKSLLREKSMLIEENKIFYDKIQENKRGGNVNSCMCVFPEKYHKRETPYSNRRISTCVINFNF